VNEAFFQARRAGQRRAAERLLAAGANINASPDDANNRVALDQAVSPDTRREPLATWVGEHGARSADGD